MRAASAVPGLVLAAGDVHVWKIVLERTNWREPHTWGLLADDEVARACRFRFEDGQRRFVVCRAALRRILARYRACHPAELLVRTGPHGKPFLDHGPDGTRLSFNVSHSHERALVAVTTTQAIGIDIEHVRDLADVDTLVARYFTPEEAQAFARATPEARLPLFFRYWTLKEAYLKAVGTGISGPLAAVHVVSGLDGRSDDGDWTVRTLAPGDGYAAAVVVAGRDHCVSQWDWQA